MSNDIGQPINREKDKMKVRDFVKPASASQYDESVAELIAAGDGKEGAITVPNDAPKFDAQGNAVIKDDVHVSDNSINNAIRGFQDAARKAERTARVTGRSDNGDGTTDIWFVLTDKRGSKATETSADEENAPDAEYPVDESTADEPTPRKGK